jgi:catalase
MNDQSKRPPLTHASGTPVTDNLNIQTAGPRGPALLQDVWLLEKLAHFHREVIPERRMHAKGSGAHGTFTVTHDITRYTQARSFRRSASRLRCSPASPRSQASVAPPTPSAISAASR